MAVVDSARAEVIFSDDLANNVSLAFESKSPDSKILFLGDLPSEVLDVVHIEPGRFHLVKAAHHGTEFGSNLEPVSADFVFISRNEREFRNQGYLSELS